MWKQRENLPYDISPDQRVEVPFLVPTPIAHGEYRLVARREGRRSGRFAESTAIEVTVVESDS